jgi:hypothetical protein
MCVSQMVSRIVIFGTYLEILFKSAYECILPTWENPNRDSDISDVRLLFYQCTNVLISTTESQDFYQVESFIFDLEIYNQH